MVGTRGGKIMFRSLSFLSFPTRNYSPLFQACNRFLIPRVLTNQKYLQSNQFCTTTQDQLQLNPVDFQIPKKSDVPVLKEENFAVVHLSGKQYKLVSGDVILTENLVGTNVGDVIRLDKILLIGTKEQTVIGTPIIENAYVLAEVQENTKSSKLIVFKKKRRKNYRRTRGVRLPITILRILDVHYDLEAATKS